MFPLKKKKTSVMIDIIQRKIDVMWKLYIMQHNIKKCIHLFVQHACC